MELIVKSMLEKPCQEAIMNYYKSAQNGQLEIVCQIGENRYPKTVPHHFGESEPIEIPVNEESAAVYSRWENTISGPRNSTQVWLHCVPLNRAISYEIFGPDGTRLASQLKYANGSELYDFTSNPDVTDCGMFHVRVKTKNLTWGKFDSLPDAYYPGEPGFCDPGRRKLAISNYSTAGWRIDGNSLSVWDGGDNNTDVSAGGGTMQITFDGELSGNAVREIVVAEYMLGAGNEVSCNVNCEQDGAKWSLSCPAECKFYTVNCFDRRDLTFLMGRLQLDVTTGRGASHVTAVWVPDYVPKCKDGHSVWVPSGQICSFDAPGSAVRTRMCADFGR